MRPILLCAIAAFLAGFVFAEQPVNDIKAEAGEEITITLASNRSTGYQWQLAGPIDKDIVELVGSKYIQTEPRRPSAGGEEKWTFKALKPGAAVMIFKYVSLQEKGAQPVKKEKVTVTVRDQTAELVNTVQREFNRLRSYSWCEHLSQ